jgi:hypothetical protein
MCGGGATTTTLRNLPAALGDDAPAGATKIANLRGRIAGAVLE